MRFEISLLNFDEGSPICRIGWLTYSRSELLNQGFDNSLRFHYRGQMIEGTILAMGLQPIPAAYRTGMRVPFQLKFADPLGRQIDVEAELYLERMAKRKNAVVRLGTGLYEPHKTATTCAVSARDDLRPAQRQHLATGHAEQYE